MLLSPNCQSGKRGERLHLSKKTSRCRHKLSTNQPAFDRSIARNETSPLTSPSTSLHFPPSSTFHLLVALLSSTPTLLYFSHLTRITRNLFPLKIVPTGTILRTSAPISMADSIVMPHQNSLPPPALLKTYNTTCALLLVLAGATVGSKFLLTWKARGRLGRDDAMIVAGVVSAICTAWDEDGADWSEQVSLVVTGIMGGQSRRLTVLILSSCH